MGAIHGRHKDNMPQRVYLQGNIGLRAKWLPSSTGGPGVIQIAITDSGAYATLSTVTLPPIATSGVGVSICESRRGQAILDLQFADGTSATYTSKDCINWVLLS